MRGDRGHYHGGLHYGIDRCGNSEAEGSNELGFKLPDCTKSRYRYLTDSGDDCAKSDGTIDQGRIYPGCNANDEWHMSSTGELSHAHDAIESCPGGANAPSSTCVAVALPPPPPAAQSRSSSPLPPPGSPPGGSSPNCHSACADGCSDWSFDPWSLWSPDTTTQCQGINFNQNRTRSATRSCSGLCAGVACRTNQTDSESQPNVGTRNCLTAASPCRNRCAAACGGWTAGSWGVWQPDESSVCTGTNFNQTRERTETRNCSNFCAGVSCSSNRIDRETRPAVGTGSCSTDESPSDDNNQDGTSYSGGGGGGGGSRGGGGGGVNRACPSCCAGDFCVAVCGLDRAACGEIKNKIRRDTGLDTRPTLDGRIGGQPTDLTPDELATLAQELVKRSNSWHNNLQAGRDDDDLSDQIRKTASEIEQRNNEARRIALEQLRKENPDERIDFADVTMRAQKLLNRDEDYQNDRKRLDGLYNIRDEVNAELESRNIRAMSPQGRRELEQARREIEGECNS